MKVQVVNSSDVPVMRQGFGGVGDGKKALISVHLHFSSFHLSFNNSFSLALLLVSWIPDLGV